MVEVTFHNNGPIEARHVRDGPWNGPYQLVATETSSQTRECKLVWLCRENGSVIREECKTNRPYALVLCDADGTLLDSEGPDGLFAVCWRGLYRLAGIEGSDESLNAFKKKIYRWNRTLVQSVQDMIDRIEQGAGGDEARKIIDPSTLRRWADENGKNYEEDQLKSRAAIIADRKEKFGKDLLESDPANVLRLAPFKEGALEFVHRIPCPFVVVSGSRAESSLLPIFNAHAKMGASLGRDVLLVGEDTILPTSCAKPDAFFYQIAAATAHHALFKERLVPPQIDHQDMLFIGDSIAQTPVLDAPGDRVMHHIVMGVDKSIPLGPLAVGVKDFPSLLNTIKQPMNKIPDYTLQRLALTLK